MYFRKDGVGLGDGGIGQRLHDMHQHRLRERDMAATAAKDAQDALAQNHSHSPVISPHSKRLAKHRNSWQILSTYDIWDREHRAELAIKNKEHELDEQLQSGFKPKVNSVSTEIAKQLPDGALPVEERLMKKHHATNSIRRGREEAAISPEKQKYLLSPKQSQDIVNRLYKRPQLVDDPGSKTNKKGANEVLTSSEANTLADRLHGTPTKNIRVRPKTPGKKGLVTDIGALLTQEDMELTHKPSVSEYSSLLAQVKRERERHVEASTARVGEHGSNQAEVSISVDVEAFNSRQQSWKAKKEEKLRVKQTELQDKLRAADAEAMKPKNTGLKKRVATRRHLDVDDASMLRHVALAGVIDDGPLDTMCDVFVPRYISDEDVQQCIARFGSGKKDM